MTNMDSSSFLINLYTFPAKLWNLVNNPENESVFWNPSGDEVIINQQTFEMELMSPEKQSKVFKSTNFTSFIRQLNLYGFKKLIDALRDPDIHHFQNPNFIRGHPELLVNMKRLTKSNRAKILFGEKTTYRAPTTILPKPEHNTETHNAEKTGSVHHYHGTESHQHMIYNRTPVPPRSRMFHHGVISPFYTKSIFRGYPPDPYRIMSSPTSMLLHQEPKYIHPSNYFTPVFCQYCGGCFVEPDRTIPDQYSYFPQNYSMGDPYHIQTQAWTPHDNDTRQGNVNLNSVFQVVDEFDGSSEAQHTPEPSAFSPYTSSAASKLEPLSYQSTWSNSLSTLDPYDITCSVSDAYIQQEHRANQTKEESAASFEHERKILDSSPKDQRPDRKAEVWDYSH